MNGRALPSAPASTGSPCSNMAWTTCAPSSTAISAGSSITGSARSPCPRSRREWAHEVRFIDSGPRVAARGTTGRTGMKFTLSWLKDHLDTDASVETIAETLTRIGLEVEEVTNPADKLAPFRVAEVLTAERHPQADKLQVLSVDAGDGPMQVVCGAPNARAGMLGVFGPPGAYVPGADFT